MQQLKFHSHTHNTASSLYAGKVQCVYCNGEHYSASCERVHELKECRELLLKSGCCFNCLKNNHKSKDCSSQRNCRYCHKRYHQSICEMHLSSPTDIHETTETSVPIPNTPDVTSTTSTANHAKSKPTALLQTAQAIASKNCSQLSRPVCILFNNGSQRSYITENLCTLLKPIRKERLHLETTNLVCSFRRCINFLYTNLALLTLLLLAFLLYAHPFQLQ